MSIRGLLIAIKKSAKERREAILEIMTDYFINDIISEDAIIEPNIIGV